MNGDIRPQATRGRTARKRCGAFKSYFTHQRRYGTKLAGPVRPPPRASSQKFGCSRSQSTTTQPAVATHQVPQQPLKRSMNAAMPRRHTSPPPPLAAVPAAPSDTLAACTRSLSSPPAVRKDRLSQIDCRWQSTCESDEMARFNKQLRRSQTDSNPTALPLVARVLSGTCGQRQAARDSKPMPPCASRARSYQPTNTHHASTCKPRDS